MNLQGRDLKKGHTGPDVVALHEELVALGFEVEFEERREGRFGETTVEAIRVFQVERGVAVTGEVDPECATAIGDARRDTWVISGRVTSPDHIAVGELVVAIVDRNIGRDEPVATTNTGDSGTYRVRATIAADFLRKRHKAAPDLQARVSARAADGSLTFLAASDVAWNASRTLTLDVTLPAGTSTLPSEYETLVAAVARLFSGSLSMLKETPEQQDLTFLAAKTGWDARAVAMAALAAQLAETVTLPASETPGAPGAAGVAKTQVMVGEEAGASKETAAAAGAGVMDAATAASGVSLQPAFYYALLRAGAPANPPQLFQMSVASAATVWDQAIAQGVIPTTLSSSLDEAKQIFLSLAANQALNAPPVVGTSTLTEQIGHVLTSAADQSRFAGLVTQFGNDPAGLWAAVKTQFPTQADQLQLVGQLNYLTINNATLANALAEVAAPAGASADLSRLVTAGLYDPATWAPYIGTSVPTGIPGDTTAEQATNYANFLAAHVKLAYPTAVLAAQVAKGTIPVANGTAAVVSRFLDDNQGNFVFGAESVEAFIARAKVAPPDADALAQIKRLQRVYQLTRSDDAMATLLQQGLDSAYAITRHDATAFADAYGAPLGSADTALAIHDRAKQIYNAVLNVAVRYGVGQRTPPLAGIGGASVGASSSSGDGSGVGGGTTAGTGAATGGGSGQRGRAGSGSATPTSIPEATLQKLFGSLDYCSCADCSSILSPAAYLVDLLHYLDTPSMGAAPPQPVLFRRRPDVQYLALSCANTNTALPYIDIVNETLEAYVAGNLDLSGYQGFDTSPDITSAELIAIPQNVNDSAYVALQQKFFPAPLPFNRPLELLRRQFEALNVSLSDAMTLLRAGDQALADPTKPASYGWSDILIERLRISRDEARLFTDATLRLGDLYGFPGVDDDTVLQNLQTMNLHDFSARTAVSYVDLVAILKTRFVNLGSALIERIEALGAGFAAIAALKTAAAVDVAAFKSNLPAGLDFARYGGTDAQAVVDWLTGPNYAAIMGLITIANPDDTEDDCKGTALKLRYADPQAGALSQDDYQKLIRFVRLWRKLQLLLAIVGDHSAIHATDALLAALYPAAPATPTEGFATALQRAGFVVELLGRLGLDGGSLTRLLACWAPIETIGKRSLYKSLFLTAVTLQEDAGAQVATVSGPLAQGDQLTTTVEGSAITYTVTAGDVGDPATAAATVASGIANALNSATTVNLTNSATYPDDLFTQRFHCLPKGAQVVITAGFHVQWTSDPAGGFGAIVAADPTDNSATINGVAPGNKFTVTIDTLPLSYVATALDDASLVARKLADVINATTTAHPYSGLPLNTLLVASSVGATVTVATAGAGAPFSLSCAGKFANSGAYTAGRLSPPFADDGYGVYLNDPSQTLFAHEPVICAGCGLTGAEFAQIAAALGFDAGTSLSLDAVSAMFRYGWLAHTLSLSVQEFLLLRNFSGLDPFAPLDFASAAPAEPPAIRFVRLVEALKDVGLPGTQALYLVWNQDPSGTLALHTRAVATLAQGLRVDFAAVQAQFTVSQDPTAADAQKLMALVYDAPDTAFFFALLNRTFGVSTPFTSATPALADAVVSDAANLLSYDDTAKTLSLVGSLTAAQMAAIAADDSSLSGYLDTLVDLWNAAVDPFFAMYPELLPLYQAYVGAIDPASVLEGILPTLVQRRKVEQALAEISAQVGCDASFAPTLLRDAAVLHADGDATQPAIVDLTGIETGGLTAQIAGASTPVSGSIAYGKPPASSPFSWTAGNPVSIAGPVSSSWTGFVAPPQTGSYGLTVVTDDDPAVHVTLSIDGDVVPLIWAHGVWTSQATISLTSGQLTSIALDVDSVTNVVALGWRCTPGLGWTLVPATALYPQAAITRLAATYTRFLKAVSLSSALSLTAKEIAWLASDTDVAPGWLSDLAGLPGSGQPVPADNGRTETLVAVLEFARLKASLSPNDVRLLAVLQDPVAVLATNGQSALLSLTFWPLPSINALLQRFFGDSSLTTLADVRKFARVFDAMKMVQACRVTAPTLIAAVTNMPSPSAIGALQSALRTSYAATDWLGVIRPINDDMRRKQRDALVAWILQAIAARSVPPNPLLPSIATVDDLYDLLLIDPATEPPVLTSRVRLALSAVQLFIERILRALELEEGIPASVFGSNVSWPAMKRYRIWQANREVFLWPENWLDQLLRDDQSPIFQDTMNSLLQGDITDDAATGAYLDYLSGLADVAKLEPCGMYYAPGSEDPSEAGANEAAYVVARSFGAHRKYYFRQLEAGSWSPWAQVHIECEDMPITPIVWGGRLFLFWLKVQKDASAATQAPAGGAVLDPSNTGAFMQSAVNLTTQTTTANQSVNMQATLWWTEYYNGKWQPPRSSDPNRPTTIGLYRPSGPYAFDAYRDQMRLVPATANLEDVLYQKGKKAPTVPPDALILSIATPADPFGERTYHGDYGGAGFLLHNTHSVPTRLEDFPLVGSDFPYLDIGSFLDEPASWREFSATGGPGASSQADLPTYGGGMATGTLTAYNYDGRTQVSSLQIMNYAWLPRIVDVPPVLADVRKAPFLYEDRLSVFYVTTTPELVKVPDAPIFQGPYSVTLTAAALASAQVHQPTTVGGASVVRLPSNGPVLYQGAAIAPTGGQFASASSVIR